MNTDGLTISQIDERLVWLWPFDRKNPMLRPDLARDAAKVLPQIADAFSECRYGQQPWPLLVSGGVGTGKTRFCLLAHDWYGGRYVEFDDLCDEFRLVRLGEFHDERWINRPLLREREWITMIGEHRLLTIDDIGRRSNQTDNSREALTKALDNRECKPMLLTTNLSPDEIPTVFDDRIASRMLSGSVVVVSARDRRIERDAQSPLTGDGAGEGKQQ